MHERQRVKRKPKIKHEKKEDKKEQARVSEALKYKYK